MKFNIVRDNPNANEKSVGLSCDEIKEFANNLYDTVKAYRLLGLNFSEGNIKTRFNNLLERANESCCNSHGCSGGKNIISIDSKGDIYPCEMMDYSEVKLGSIYHDDNLNDNQSLVKQVKEAIKNNIYFKKKINKECNTCPWYYYCKGGCTSRILYSKGKMKYDEVECEFNKVIYERIVDDLLTGIRKDDING